ncbi:hypothetical protein C5167_018261 [Papaver somniferum]|uniref:Uncharacterized protein n=1 Tax=Papaver somniferum TaxID=3469 RepID=A0A4Y7IQS6_PAPSO|nr:hypothetical protein C5167_018261 [Papaver somniferum]
MFNHNQCFGLVVEEENGGDGQEQEVAEEQNELQLGVQLDEHSREVIEAAEWMWKHSYSGGREKETGYSFK